MNSPPKTTFSRALLPKKAFLLIIVTEGDMYTFLSEVQFENASVLMYLVLLGKNTSLSDSHFEKA